ncbi:hypothetical protein BC936DRAFT_140532 [Jimgerdemannia flammicorona]|uniref:Uncharacterized protein n=1 Tax=Jimgerdemannia flammicorona TaxID=994334 RepID=A0A433AQ29_9FUNG|nr:hypothetical protein BC936DRAFT_140532 [Jimgerdemannia flammicorona]
MHGSNILFLNSPADHMAKVVEDGLGGLNILLAQPMSSPAQPDSDLGEPRLAEPDESDGVGVVLAGMEDAFEAREGAI